MSSADHNLSSFDAGQAPSAAGMRIGIVVSEWNADITEALYKGAYDCLLQLGCLPKNIIRRNVPGSFELPLGAQWVAEYEKADAVICLGCVIQGETRHFEFICQSVADGLMNLGIRFSLPFIFGVLTPDTLQQAQDRAGGKHGNKGIEAAVTAVKMAALRRELRNP